MNNESSAEDAFQREREACERLLKSNEDMLRAMRHLADQWFKKKDGTYAVCAKELLELSCQHPSL